MITIMTNLLAIVLFAMNFFTFIEAQPQINSLTWNMQGACQKGESKWTTVVQQYLKYNDVLALQEAGSVPLSAVRLNPVGQAGQDILEYSWNSAHIYHFDLNRHNSRVNLAIVSITQADETFVFPSLPGGSRPVIGIRVGDSYYFNMHAGAHPNNEAPDQVRAIEHYMVNNVLNNNRNANWMIMGDFNRIPGILINSLSLPIGFRREILNSRQPTHSSGFELDYAVGGRGTGIIQVPGMSARIMANLHVVSDHLPVLFRTRGCGL